MQNFNFVYNKHLLFACYLLSCFDKKHRFSLIVDVSTKNGNCCELLWLFPFPLFLKFLTKKFVWWIFIVLLGLSCFFSSMQWLTSSFDFNVWLVNSNKMRITLYFYILYSCTWVFAALCCDYFNFMPYFFGIFSKVILKKTKIYAFYKQYFFI